MIEFKSGDKVHVEFDSTVHAINGVSDWITVEASVGQYTTVPAEFLTKIQPKLPTTIGSVIRIIKWQGSIQHWVALLTRKGWHVSVDEHVNYFDGSALAREGGPNFEWEPIYRPEAES